MSWLLKHLTPYPRVLPNLAENTWWLPEDGGLAEEKPKAEELKSPNSSVRESTRLKNKATVSAKAKQDCARAQQDSGQPTLHSSVHQQACGVANAVYLPCLVSAVLQLTGNVTVYPKCNVTCIRNAIVSKPMQDHHNTDVDTDGCM